jgi:hypothetical protein
VDADERQREAVDPDAEGDERDRRRDLTAELPVPGRPRKSSMIPTLTAIAAPSSRPRFSWLIGRKASAGTSMPRKSAIPPRRGTGSWFTRRPPGTSTTPSRRAIPPTAGVSRTTTPNATSAPQRTSR